LGRDRPDRLPVPQGLGRSRLKAPGAFLDETLQSQPDEVGRLLGDPPSPSVLSRLSGCSRIFLVGTGTSYHGALVGQYLLRSAGADAWAIPAFEFVNYPPRIQDDDGLLLLSHRGTKRFSQAAIQAFGNQDHWVAVTGEGSPLQGPGVITTVPQERSPVHTASHTGAMVRLAQLAVALGSPPWTEELAWLPDAMRTALALRPQVVRALDRVSLDHVVHFVGGGPAHATALEGALKLREAAWVSTEGHELESILHGPLISLNADDTVVLIAQPGASLERTAELMAALHEIGTPTLAIGPAAARLTDATAALETPSIDELLAPIVNVIPLQCLALEASRRLGVDADSFRKEGRYAAAQAKFSL
jgi:glutamine---fructose-6-phosphate transaminase (isomerizing)